MSASQGRVVLADYGPVSRRLHTEALEQVREGKLDLADSLLTQATREALDLELLNDLAVVRSGLGRKDEAQALLGACLALEPGRADATENLAAIAPQGWRGSATLGGADPQMPERAFPGMPAAPVMSEHAIRYAFVLGFVGRLHVLDLGCGTGYGSEMLTWAAASVRGFDLWRPAEHEQPRWNGGAVLTYGHDLCTDPLPQADVAVMFEVLEHLADGPAALRLAWQSVRLLLLSFPNPVYHGSHHNPYHVNDWTLDEVERRIVDAARDRFHRVELTHLSQAGGGLLVPGRDPAASYWIVLAAGFEQ